MSHSALAQREDLRQDGCQHHWVIELPSGPMSTGRCRKCGNQQEFSSYIEVPDAWAAPSHLRVPNRITPDDYVWAEEEAVAA